MERAKAHADGRTNAAGNEGNAWTDATAWAEWFVCVRHGNKKIQSKASESKQDKEVEPSRV